MIFIIILLLSILILLLYNYYVNYGRNGRLINLIPGPQGYPVLGNILQTIVSAGKYKYSNLFTIIINKQFIIYVLIQARKNKLIKFMNFWTHVC